MPLTGWELLPFVNFSHEHSDLSQHWKKFSSFWSQNMTFCHTKKQIINPDRSFTKIIIPKRLRAWSIQIGLIAVLRTHASSQDDTQGISFIKTWRFVSLISHQTKFAPKQGRLSASRPSCITWSSHLIDRWLLRRAGVRSVHDDDGKVTHKGSSAKLRKSGPKVHLLPPPHKYIVMGLVNQNLQTRSMQNKEKKKTFDVTQNKQCKNICFVTENAWVNFPERYTNTSMKAFNNYPPSFHFCHSISSHSRGPLSRFSWMSKWSMPVTYFYKSDMGLQYSHSKHLQEQNRNYFMNRSPSTNWSKPLGASWAKFLSVIINFLWICTANNTVIIHFVIGNCLAMTVAWRSFSTTRAQNSRKGLCYSSAAKSLNKEEKKKKTPIS